jgi:outer membrane immunogenic protein
MIRRILLASASVVALTAAASAADMYVAPAPGGYKDAPYVPSWAGFYAGVNGGYGWANPSTVSDTETTNSTQTVLSKSFSPDGGFGGGQIGYNWQPGTSGYKDGPGLGSIVLGIEADIQGADIKGSGNVAFDPSHFATGSTEINWFGTVRGRLGYAIGNALIYGTGGFAFGGVHDKLSKQDPDGAQTVSDSKTATGYVVGGGLEYLFSPKWSAKVEYQYLDLGSTTLTADSIVIPKFNEKLDADHAFSTVRLGVNYHFTPVYEPLK